jgi:hypothetical protein
MNVCVTGDFSKLKEWFMKDENKDFRNFLWYKYKGNKKEFVKSLLLSYRNANPNDPIFDNDSFAQKMR